MSADTKRSEASEVVALASLPTREGLPTPAAGERPTAYADRVGQWYAAQTSEQQRKANGLYLTPVVVADFMAGWLQAQEGRVRVLDPAAGAGILCCAAAEALAAHPLKPVAIDLVAYEVDRDLVGPLRAVLDYLAAWCRNHFGVAVSVRVEATDFVLANAGALRPRGLFAVAELEGVERFDIAIANPPYFKIGKNDPRAAAAAEVVHGQPNIYSLFMAVGAALLCPNGEFVFITPRSFASGPYFRRFREVFFDLLRPTRVHLFGSRRDAFRRDEVLQESVILAGRRDDRWRHSAATATLIISASQGVGDIDDSRTREVATGTVLDLAAKDKVLRLPAEERDEAALAIVDEWPASLHKLGLRISTGPVVPFRARRFVDDVGEVPARHAPLLWMSHVKAMRTTWPLGGRQPEYIARAGAESLLLPNRNYVLIRRFSAKEEARRLTAAPYQAAEFPGSEVGIENHLNYVYRPAGELTEDEAWGLAALFSSRLLDTWFRAVNGNTQVSATELRAMPLPSHDVIVALGSRVKVLADPLAYLDELVAGLSSPPVLEQIVNG